MGKTFEISQRLELWPLVLSATGGLLCKGKLAPQGSPHWLSQYLRASRNAVRCGLRSKDERQYLALHVPEAATRPNDGLIPQCAHNRLNQRPNTRILDAEKLCPPSWLKGAYAGQKDKTWSEPHGSRSAPTRESPRWCSFLSPSC